MQVRHRIGGFCHRINYIISEVAWVWRHEAHSLQTSYGTAFADQICKSLAVTKIYAVGINVLTKERNFHNALVN